MKTILAFVVVVVAVAVGWRMFEKKEDEVGQREERNVKTTMKVFEESVRELERFTTAASIIKINRPVVLRRGAGSPSDEWPALVKWNFTSLPTLVEDGIVFNATQMNDRERQFLYFNKKAKMRLSKGRYHWQQPVAQVKDVTVQEMCRHAISNSEDVYLYWSSTIDHLGRNMVGDVEPVESLMGIKAMQSVNFWIGTKGVTSSTHYDNYNNFFVQIYGEKRFLLAAPTSWRALPLYPSFHPSYRQSQIDLIQVVEENRNVVVVDDNLTVFSVTLRAGDVLYIPPWWYHRVEGLTASISVNVWTDSFDLENYDALLGTALPFENDWTIEKRVFAVLRFTELLLHRCINPVGENYLHSLWLTRYHPLSSSGHTRVTSTLPQQCFVSSIDIHPELPQKVFEERIDQIICPILNRFRAGVVDIVLFDWIEEMALWAVDGDIDQIESVLTCWQSS